jgi:hypothetical protein
MLSGMGAKEVGQQNALSLLIAFDRNYEKELTMTEQPILEIMGTIIELFWAHDMANIKDLPGAAEIKIDDKWYIAANGHDVEVEVIPKGTMGAKLPPYHFAVWYLGWIAGIFNPCGGEFIGGLAEDEFCAAVQKHIERMQNHD